MQKERDGTIKTQLVCLLTAHGSPLVVLNVWKAALLDRTRSKLLVLGLLRDYAKSVEGIYRGLPAIECFEPTLTEDQDFSAYSQTLIDLELG